MLAILLSLVICLTTLVAKRPSKDKPVKKQHRETGTCHFTSQFQFDPIEPTYSHLSYCTYLRPQTCCNRTHTDEIISIIYPYFEENVTNDCREIGINIGCSSCDPRLGTREIIGLCPQLCESWFNACNESFFQYDNQNKLIPCSQNNVVCTKLNEIVSNGIEMCQQSGFDINYKSIECYNGTLPKLKHQPSYGDESEWKAQLQRALNEFTKRFEKLAIWQQLLILISMSFVVYSIVVGLKRLILRCIFGDTIEDGNNNSNNINGASEAVKAEAEEHRRLIREKRMKWLKEEQIKKMENVERDLAKYLGNVDEDTLKDSLQDLANEAKENVVVNNKNNESTKKNNNQMNNNNNTQTQTQNENNKNNNERNGMNDDSDNEDDNGHETTKSKKKRRRKNKNKNKNSQPSDGYSAENDD